MQQLCISKHMQAGHLEGLHAVDRWGIIWLRYFIMTAMFEDEIVYDEVYVPPQYEEQPINSEGDGLKLVYIVV